MPTIRIHDWTKEQLEVVREVESHSSYDSVVKALLRDRKLAQAVEDDVDIERMATTAAGSGPQKRLEDLTALAEVEHVEKGIMFLWCPNCGNEIAHLDTENPINVSVFETQCQQCLTELDHHAIVTVEIGYPVEEKSVENELEFDLQACVLDYWHRTLSKVEEGTLDDSVDDEYLVWKIFQYSTSFDWDWPAEMPAVGIEPGRTYRNRESDELIEVIEAIDDHQAKIGSYRVKIRDNGDPPDEGTPTTIEPDELTALICDRTLLRTDH